ncbi:MAG: hypothetical protein AAGF04_01235 [Chlamydiota bacterium]
MRTSLFTSNAIFHKERIHPLYVTKIVVQDQYTKILFQDYLCKKALLAIDMKGQEAILGISLERCITTFSTIE